ncbi:methionine/alanine import family NSS transporter small subunit [Planococcus sp. ISL-109]|nr:methionine/alanine import family NSS transporter small subunit [Planococcus sp. ISL-109]MBT2583656.1 methionine/alanine import family NSS transporter small subunit [Planococcus sp. ISL-109]
MSVSAIVVMIIGMVLLWGGLAASIFHAVRSSKANKAKEQNIG